MECPRCNCQSAPTVAHPAARSASGPTVWQKLIAGAPGDGVTWWSRLGAGAPAATTDS